ncbi:hypothetical protein [Maribacter cobaltidurans]|uniref:Uncharacterized protein n=1 Tax=Maribacter cobaltidurans TaxID=1178778 RepID=A0A223V766_9FLAO|nr:hypothetical protein [Maribacter cobaltidurans]ASV30980.1 hypothetical protein CJ263_12560 [Maribacter cobaltidurans]GGD90208.1 hypothetical protein GCM10011412_30240 [Maribacter cobaltidurans]
MKINSKLIWGILLFIGFSAQAQQLGDFKPKDATFGLGKLKASNKRIYISNFSINYQLFNEKEKTKKGGALFRDKGVRGDATAELMVGLGDLTEADFQTIANNLYQDFVADLNSKGYEIISSEAAGKTETYSGWAKDAGPKVEISAMPGMIIAYPEGYSFYYKEESKVGKFFGDKFAALDKTPQNLSRDLDDAIVVDVDLYVFFMKDLYAFQGNAANIKIKTQLSLVANEAVSAKSDKGFVFKKKVEYATGINSIYFAAGKYKIGGSAESTYTGTLKKDFTIGGVLDEKKIQSYAQGAVDVIGTSNYFGKTYRAENKISSKTTIIDVDPQKYIEGVTAAGKKFLEYHLNEFNKALK